MSDFDLNSIIFKSFTISAPTTLIVFSYQVRLTVVYSSFIYRRQVKAVYHLFRLLLIVTCVSNAKEKDKGI